MTVPTLIIEVTYPDGRVEYLSIDEYIKLSDAEIARTTTKILESRGAA